MIDDCSQKEKLIGAYVKFNDLEGIRKNSRAFKDCLLQIVMQQGGLKKLSEMTKIPQLSNSRFFSTGSIPRRSTLMKIAKALHLDVIQIARE